jgi:hypothetical protein
MACQARAATVGSLMGCNPGGGGDVLTWLYHMGLGRFLLPTVSTALYRASACIRWPPSRVFYILESPLCMDRLFIPLDRAEAMAENTAHLAVGRHADD